MYVITTASRRIEKKYKEIVEATTDAEGNCKLKTLLQNTPKGNAKTHKEISKKKNFWSYDLSWGDRVTYKVYDNERINDKPVVVIYFIGNHKDYETFLRSNS